MAVVLITGTSTGIGLATAVAFGRGGYDVYATMRNADRAPELASIAAVENLPIKVLPLDVDDDASVGRAVQRVIDAAGHIDVLVNNAGIMLLGAVEELSLSDFRRIMETNYFGALRCIQAVIPGMRQRRSGHIINVSSTSGRMSASPAAAYCASKFALEAASEALAAELKLYGVRVSIVEPGVTATPIFAKQRPVPAHTRYPQERRQLALYEAMLTQPIPPSMVADLILEVAESKSWKLRYPAGPGAAELLQLRASIPDERWIELQAVESDQEWAQIIKHHTGLAVKI
jgi:NAD(P)-dependent dehydrogenase (short-subunit alcohol dehydrogenase family)